MDKTIYSEGHKALVKKLIVAREARKLRQEDVAKLLGSRKNHRLVKPRRGY